MNTIIGSIQRRFGTLFHDRAFMRDAVIMLLLLIPFIVAVFYGSELTAAIVLVCMFAIGAVVRPRHIWLVWIVAVLPVAAYVLIWQLTGGEPIGDSGAEETPLSIFFEWSIAFAPMLILLPMWAGRLARSAIESFREGHHGPEAI